MYKTFCRNFHIKCTYTTNGLIYFIKTLPFLKKRIGDQIYAQSIIKDLAVVIGIIITIGKTLFGKVLYFLLLTLFSTSFASDSMTGADAFVNIFFFFSIFGAWLNTSLCEVDTIKYTSIYHLKMDARKVIISEYIYYLLVTAVTFLPALTIIMLILGKPFYWGFVLTMYVLLLKIVAVKLKIFLAIRFNRLEDDSFNLKELGIASIFLVSGVVLTFLYFSVGYVGVLVATVLLLVPAFFAAKSLWNYTGYARFYKKLFEKNNAIVLKQNRTELMKKNSNKVLNTDVVSVSTNKKGYKYFHYIFVKRHRKLLMKASVVIAIIEAVLALAVVIPMLIFPELKAEINSGITKVVPFFMYVFLFTNRGASISQVMFANCDSSMLNYSFYRKPKMILALFKERLKTNILVDGINAGVIAVALPVLLWLSGGTQNPFEYALLFVTIIAISVFFSVHHLVMYYVLQPYNKALEIKNPAYQVVTFVLYIVCFSVYSSGIEVVTFGSIFVVFSVVYIIVGLILAYKLAPKTFRIK